MKFNAREGVRRLAIVVGILCAMVAALMASEDWNRPIEQETLRRLIREAPNPLPQHWDLPLVDEFRGKTIVIWQIEWTHEALGRAVKKAFPGGYHNQTDTEAGEKYGSLTTQTGILLFRDRDDAALFTARKTTLKSVAAGYDGFINAAKTATGDRFYRKDNYTPRWQLLLWPIGGYLAGFWFVRIIGGALIWLVSGFVAASPRPPVS